MRKEVSKIISTLLWDNEAIKISKDEPFKMTSGKSSPIYIDLRALISNTLAREIITTFACWIYETEKLCADWIAGGETAGIPYAAWLADKLRKPFIYVRKEPKGHGLTSQVEGKIEPGKLILLCEDLVTDGKSKLNFISGIRKAKCDVKDCLVIFDRQEGGKETLLKEGVNLHSLTTMDECLEIGLKNGYLSKEKFDFVKEHLNK